VGSEIFVHSSVGFWMTSFVDFEWDGRIPKLDVLFCCDDLVMHTDPFAVPTTSCSVSRNHELQGRNEYQDKSIP
jgi:hypothetical protein